MEDVQIVYVQLGKKTFFETVNKDGYSLVLLNENRPLVEEIGWRLHAMKKCNDESVGYCIELAKVAASLLDILLLSYAEAENLFANPDQFSHLRSSWGHITAEMLKSPT